MNQSKKSSMLEAALNTASGFCVAWILTYFILPLYGHETSVNQAWEITVWFSIASIIRSYLWRRTFNNGRIKTWVAILARSVTQRKN